jgi:hypothetical protein
MLQGRPPARGRFERFDRRLWVVAAAVVVVLVSFPFWGGALGARLARDALAGRLGVGVAIERGRAGLRSLSFHRVRIAEGEKIPLAVIERIEVPYSAAWGKGRILLEGARFEIERGGPGDNVSTLLARLSPSGKGGATGGGARSTRRNPAISIRGATVRAKDLRRGAAIAIEGLSVDLVPDQDLVVETAAFAGIVRVRGGENDPKFGAGRLRMTLPLEGLRPRAEPKIEVAGGYVTPLPNLGLTGIKGTVTPVAGAIAGADADTPRSLTVALEGSYGGARESLWHATGEVRPPVNGHEPEMTMALRAARFSLERIQEVLPPSILDPAKTSVDAKLDLAFREGQLAFKGTLEVTGLNLHHDAVATEEVRGLNLGLALDGKLDPVRRRLELAKLQGRMRGLEGTLWGAVELAAGRFKFTDGSEMPMLPKIEIGLKVPKISCAKLLDSIPGPMISHLQGFAMQGTFEAHVGTKIDYANLEAIELDGKVGIDGCKVTKAPDEVVALAGPGSLTHVVEIPSPDKNALPGATELMAFPIGPDNPNFVPFDQISPYLINSIMTTEDGGFFKHRGWVSSEFRTALKRNLAGGGFRLGASSITMQMVKNVLLSREKTLSRKLQELFLVWHLEKILPKERILELYFNAIEFGPRIYGIGEASKHYFGKHASQLTPLEAAFFSSIMPNPKRRYIQYCHGQLYPPWDKYVRRILARVHERGRLTEEEYNLAAAQPLQFDLTSRTMTEQDCLAWIKKVTFRLPERDPAAPPEVEN